MLKSQNGYQPMLSPQECTILAHLWDGLQRKEVATAMNLSDKTVKNYIHSLYQKLQVTNGIQAVRKGLELGVLKATPLRDGDWP